MPKPRLPHTYPEKTRHGRKVWYFRGKKGGPRIRLPDDYGSDAFMAAYRAALSEAPVSVPKVREKSGTLRWMFALYMRSAAFEALAPITRQNRSAIMRKIADNAGEATLEQITADVIRRGMEDRARTPGSANNFLKTMRAAYKWAVDANVVKTDPTAVIKKLRVKTTGYHTWTLDEIARFEAVHPIGTKARLALDLLLYTGLRPAHTARAGRQHIRGDSLTIETQKTGEVITVPVLAPLARSIEAAATGDLVFLVTDLGKPFTAAGFGNWFRDQCRKAGVKGSAHGIRKAAATHAAERGATTTDLMAIFGWTSAQMAEVYTRAADRKRIGMRAGKLLDREQSNDRKSRTFSQGAEPTAKKSTKSDR